jgi:hypothetical protein
MANGIRSKRMTGAYTTVVVLALATAAVLGLSGLTWAQNAQQGEQGRSSQQGQQAQPSAAPKSMKEALAGTWRLLIADAVNPDNTQTPLFGPNPSGSLIITPNGHFSLQVVRYNRPKFAANDRLKGTPDENKAAIQGIFTAFGAWTLDEPSKTLALRIEASSYPNLDETTQKYTITALNPNDVLTYTVPNPATGSLPLTVAWKWVP